MRKLLPVAVSVLGIAFATSPQAQASPGPAAAPSKAPPAMEPPTSVAQSLDRQFGFVEHDLVPLVEAMPADRFDFAPPGEGFKGVRTFKQQVGHVAAAIYLASATLLGVPSTITEEDLKGGPARLKTKEDYVSFLKEAFAEGHKAIAGVSDKNLLEVVGPKDRLRGTRLGLANFVTWHSFDHYGQLVVYLRMNGLVPPASRERQ